MTHPRGRAQAHYQNGAACSLTNPMSLTAKEKLNRIASSSDIGAGLLLQLVKEVSPDSVIQTIKAMLEATTISKDGRELPDWRAREAGAKLFMNYTVGMPIQRVVTQERKSEDDGATMERLLASPAAKEALRKALAIEEA